MGRQFAVAHLGHYFTMTANGRRIVLDGTSGQAGVNLLLLRNAKSDGGRRGSYDGRGESGVTMERKRCQAHS